MYTALDAASFIVEYCSEKGYHISNLRLQRLLYMVQAYYLALAEKGEPCFREDIIAMDFGPVVPEIYQGLIRFGNGCLYPPLEACFPGLWSSSDSLVEKDKERIGEVVDAFSAYDSTDLFQLIAGQTPWRDARCRNGNHAISKSLFKISGWGEGKGIFLHSKEKSGGILCGFRAFLTPSVRKKRLSGALTVDFE